MRDELADVLYKVAPTLYRGRTKPITQSLMAFGVECGDGWFALLLDLSVKLETVITVAEWGDDLPEALQVKVKWSELRFYMTHDANPLIELLIREAEGRASRTCETCGCPGRRRTQGWASVLCDDCLKNLAKPTAENSAGQG